MPSFLFLWSVDFCWHDAAESSPRVIIGARFWSGNLLMIEFLAIQVSLCGQMSGKAGIQLSRDIGLIDRARFNSSSQVDESSG